MASSKNVWKSVIDASNTDDYVGPVTRSRSKALDWLQPQPTKEGKLHTISSLDFLANRKATAKDSSISKDLEINNESSPTKTFYINSLPVMRNLRNEVPLTHHVSLFSPSYLKVMPVMMTNTSTMEEKMAKMEQMVSFSQKHLRRTIRGVHSTWPNPTQLNTLSWWLGVFFFFFFFIFRLSLGRVWISKIVNWLIRIT